MPMSSSGLTIIRIISIIQMVFACIAIAALLILSLILMIGGSSLTEYIISQIPAYYLNEIKGFDLLSIVGILGVVIFITTLFIGALLIIVFIIQLKLLRSMIETIQTGYPQANYAKAYSIICYIIGAICAFGVFGGLASIALSPASGLVAFICSAAGSAIYFILGILVGKYDNAVKSVNY